jgi:hypothetical protein
MKSPVLLDGALYFEESYCRVPEIPSIILAGSMTRFESVQHALVIEDACSKLRGMRSLCIFKLILRHDTA